MFKKLLGPLTLGVVLFAQVAVGQQMYITENMACKCYDNTVCACVEPGDGARHICFIGNPMICYGVLRNADLVMCVCVTDKNGNTKCDCKYFK